MLLLLLFNYVFTLVGMQLFGGKFDVEDERYVKENYDTFWIAYLTTFNIITLDNWIDLMALGLNNILFN